jgi:hypothetical protein
MFYWRKEIGSSQFAFGEGEDSGSEISDNSFAIGYTKGKPLHKVRWVAGHQCAGARMLPCTLPSVAPFGLPAAVFRAAPIAAWFPGGFFTGLVDQAMRHKRLFHHSCGCFLGIEGVRVNGICLS